MISDEPTKTAVKNFCLLFCGKRKEGQCGVPVEERDERCIRIAGNVWELGLTETQERLAALVEMGVPA